MRLALFLMVTVTACAAQTAAPGAVPHENLNAVAWMQTSAEYHASVLGAFRSAESALLKALADQNWTAAVEQSPGYREKPPAVILDLDETVLDNSAFQARLTANGETFSDVAWTAWVNEQAAGLLPGALRFLTLAHAHGVMPFYITNRVCDAKNPQDPTLLLLVRHALPMTGDVLCKESASASSDKAPRRRRVAMSHRILLILGDDFNDFVTVSKQQSTMEGRRTLVEAYSSYWGERWFVIPNPSYGSWERATGYTVDQKRKSLRIGR